ncbi:MAG: hypothetical protein ABH804_01670 [archaeon]
MKSMSDLEKNYSVDFEKIVLEIKKKRAKIVLLQFADGLKPYATAAVDFLEGKTEGKTEFLIWLGSCFGACDTPILPREFERKIDLIVQVGHNELMPKF